MPRTGQPAVRHVGAVERAIAVLDALSGGSPELGTNEIARRTGINASTVSRLLATLANARLVEHVPASGRYRLGPRLLQLGSLVLGRLDLRDVARPHLQELVRTTGMTATLSAPGEHDAVTVDFVQSDATVQSVARVGRPSIGHATAAGKVLVAWKTREEIRHLLPLRLEKFTEDTVTDVDEFVAELSTIRRDGYSTAVGELARDLFAASAPVRDSTGAVVAAISIAAPTSRMTTEKMPSIAPDLVEIANAISKGLGYTPDAGTKPAA